MSNAPPPTDPSAYFQDLIHAGQQSIKRFDDALALAMGVGPKTSEQKQVFSPFAFALDMQRDYVTQLWRFWNAAFIRTVTGGTCAAVEPARGDKRFRDAAWQDTPYYDLLKQSYPVMALREATIGRGGMLPGKELAFTFGTLRANDLIWRYVVDSYLKGATPDAFDLLYWDSDSVSLPGPMYCWYTRNTYLENKIREPNKTTQCGLPIDLSRVDVPLYLLASREDHIVPWQSAYLSKDIIGKEPHFVLAASGHVAGVINPPARNKRNFWLNENLNGTAIDWLERAEEKSGSWWPDWDSWMKRHSSGTVSAPLRAGNSGYSVIEPAPGRYVKQKSN